MMTSFNDNKDKVCLLLKDNVGGSRVRSHTRSRAGSHDHRFHDYGVTIAFFFDMSSDKQVILKNYLQLSKNPPNPIRERGRKPVLL